MDETEIIDDNGAPLTPPTSLNIRRKEGHRLWCVLVIRSNSADIETLPELHHDKAAAVRQADACRDRWQGVQLAVSPVVIEAAQLELVDDAGEVRIVADGIEGSSRNQ